MPADPAALVLLLSIIVCGTLAGVTFTLGVIWALIQAALARRRHRVTATSIRRAHDLELAELYRELAA